MRRVGVVGVVVNCERAGLVLLGTGDRTVRTPPHIEAMFRARGIRVESMSSSAAGSTFNILNDEGRDVVAALLPITPVSAKDEVLPESENKTKT